MIFAIMVTVCFAACDDKDDNKQEANTCDPATCEMAANATEMACDDAGQCVVKACAETFKVAEDAKSCEVDVPACVCDPACKDNEDCIKSEGDKCECREKDKPAACDPACEDDKTKCECTNDACACVPVNPPANECDGKSAGDECAEGKTCQDDNGVLACKDKPADPPTADDPCKDKEAGADCGDNKVCTAGDDGKLACADKPADPPADPCKDKAEGDACGENKTCQKEADALVCKDAAAPTQPDPAE